MFVGLNKKKIGVFLVLSFIAMQYYRPNKNSQEIATVNDFLISENASKEVSTIIKNSCYDCHSNYTNYDWYDNMAPVSWFVDNTIKKGKYVLNFSEWKSTELIEKKIMLSAIPFDVNTDKMPKENYLIMKSKTQLTKEEKQQLINWINIVKANTSWVESLRK